MDATFAMGMAFIALFTEADGSKNYTGPWTGYDNCMGVIAWNMEQDDTIAEADCIPEYNDTAPVVSLLPKPRPVLK